MDTKDDDTRCAFCDKDLSTFSTVDSCVIHLNGHYSNELILASMAKKDGVMTIKIKNKSGPNKGQYINVDKDEFMKRYMSDMYPINQQESPMI
jgi:aerobic-type carbon monoxide dehydrogenase small subunit (CoxS/CutS family)